MCINLVARMSRSPDGAQRNPGRRSKGFTLIEMIVLILVISIFAVGLFGVFTSTAGRSADPMLRVQAVAIAQGYLDEALLQPFNNPDVAAETGSCEAAEARSTYDDVKDYDCINDTGAHDQLGNPITGLEDYNVTMTVTELSLNRLVEVSVTVKLGTRDLVTLVGRRARY